MAINYREGRCPLCHQEPCNYVDAIEARVAKENAEREKEREEMTRADKCEAGR